MRKSLAFVPVLLLFSVVYAQTPTELIGELTTSVGSVEGLVLSLSLAVIVGAVSYMGLNRIWRDNTAMYVAAAMALATFVFTFTPSSNVGIPTVSLPRFFATIPVVRDYPILIDIIAPLLAILLFAVVIYRFRGTGEHGARKTAFFTSLVFMIAGAVIFGHFLAVTKIPFADFGEMLDPPKAHSIHG